MGVVDLIVRLQFTSSCSEDLSIWLKQNNPKSLDKLSPLADQYLAARNQKLSNKEVIKRDSARAGVKDNHSGFPPASNLKCFLCNRVGHRAIDCRVKPDGGRNEYNRPARHVVTCDQRGKIGHEKRFCWNNPRPQAAPRGGGNTPRPPSQPYGVGCAAQVGRLSDDAKVKNEEYLELKSGKKIKVVRNGACMGNETRKCMPLVTRKVGENVVKVYSDQGCGSGYFSTASASTPIASASTNKKRPLIIFFNFCESVACLLLHFIILRGQKSLFIAITLPTSLELIVPNYFVFLFLRY